MTGVGASADAPVSILHDGQYVIRIPNFVISIVGPPPVLMNSDTDIKLFDEFLDDIQIVYRFSRDSVKAKLLPEDKYLSPLRFAARSDNAIIDWPDMVFRELRLDLFDHIIRGVMIPFHIWLVRTQFLPRIKFDYFSARGGGLFNRFKNAESIEGVSLAADGDAEYSSAVGDGFGFCRIANG